MHRKACVRVPSHPSVVPYAKHVNVTVCHSAANPGLKFSFIQAKNRRYHLGPHAVYLVPLREDQILGIFCDPAQYTIKEIFKN